MTGFPYSLLHSKNKLNNITFSPFSVTDRFQFKINCSTSVERNSGTKRI